MLESIEAMNVQLWYLENYLEKGDIESAVNTPIENENTPYKIFEHAIITLYKSSEAAINGKDMDEIQYSFNTQLPVKERILKAYKEGIGKFNELKKLFKDRQDEYVKGSNRTYLQVHSTILMHTIHHIGQAMFLTNIELRKQNK